MFIKRTFFPILNAIGQTIGNTIGMVGNAFRPGQVVRRPGNNCHSGNNCYLGNNYHCQGNVCRPNRPNNHRPAGSHDSSSSSSSSSSSEEHSWQGQGNSRLNTLH